MREGKSVEIVALSATQYMNRVSTIAEQDRRQAEEEELSARVFECRRD